MPDRDVHRRCREKGRTVRTMPQNEKIRTLLNYIRDGLILFPSALYFTFTRFARDSGGLPPAKTPVSPARSPRAGQTPKPHAFRLRMKLHSRREKRNRIILH